MFRVASLIPSYDKDFGELAAGAPLAPYIGVVPLRVPAPNNAARAATVAVTIEARADWAGHFTVVEPGRIRMRPLS